MEAGDRLVRSTVKQAGEAAEAAEGADWVEPICRADPSRFVLFPMRHPDLWEMYKRHEASFWTAEEVDLSQDMEDWRVRRGNACLELLVFFAYTRVCPPLQSRWPV